MAEQQFDKKILASQKEDVALGRKLLVNVEDDVRRRDKWVPISEEYLRGCEETLGLLLNKGKDDFVKYLLDVIKDAAVLSGKYLGKKDLWERIQTKVPTWASAFDAILLSAEIEREAAEARFIGSWEIVSNFGVLDSQYSFLSPERNGIPATRVTQIQNFAKITRAKYKY